MPTDQDIADAKAAVLEAKAIVAKVTRDNSAICDQVLALNNQIHLHLVEGKFIPPIDPPQHVQSVLALLKQVDRLVLGLDRGSGHVTLGA